MPRQPRFQVSQAKQGWYFNVPATVSKSGQRERYFYKTRDEAYEASAIERKKYREHGSQAATISPSLAEAAVRAAERLRDHGLTLDQAIADYLTILERRELSIPLAEAAERWLEAKSHLRQATLKSYRYTLKRLEPLDSELMSEITADQVEEVLDSKATSFEMHRRNARGLFEFAAGKGWCQPGTIRGIKKRDRDQREICPLSPSQVRKILEAAEDYYPETVAAFAVATFAGIRMGELARLKWAQVYADGIEILSSTAKRRRRRFIPMNPTLQAWLKGRRPEDPDMLVIPGNWPAKWCAVRRLAGFKVRARILKEPPELPADAPPWPQNSLRHTHASAAVASGISLGELTFAFGHVGGEETLKSHYVGAYRPNDAIAFWKIGPKGTKIETIRAA